MKKKYLIVIALASIMFASCSSGGSSAVDIANQAIAALNNITDNWTCTTTTFTSCQCPGGGTVVFSGVMSTAATTTKATQTATATACKDSNTGLIFDGEMSVDDDTGAGTMDFTTFGNCQSVEGTFDLSGDNCSGTATGTCGGLPLTCNWVDGPDDNCICAS